ncbi:MAG: prolyl oligopeptidase family serine peptidase, partial [Prevotellaceae bacterium]|nr:prolyl oligopeptidase family serine peptidase [Prevotellaceae bacterium]
KVGAIIEISAPTDFNKWNDILKAAKLPKSWLNGNTDSSFVGQLSPVNYVRKDCPPVFIAHGKDDSIIPYEQAEILYKSLKDKGVDCKFIVIEDGKHTLNAEQRYRVVSAMRKFIKKTLNL